MGETPSLHIGSLQMRQHAKHVHAIMSKRQQHQPHSVSRARYECAAIASGGGKASVAITIEISKAAIALSVTRRPGELKRRYT